MPDRPSTPIHEHEENLVFAAVEDFIEQHQAGQLSDLGSFLSKYPRELRTRIEQQCRTYLSFDDVVGATPPDRASSEERRLGDFRIREELGRGGMGIVYLAEQVSLERTVALKVMAAGLSLSSRHVERFRREAAAAARLNHPGIVPVYASGEIEGTLYTAMEYVAGRDLASRIEEMRNEEAQDRKLRRLGILKGEDYRAEVAECVAQVAEALEAAHDAGIIHRDIKPSNVLIGLDGRVRVVDFGLAKAIDTTSVSVSGELTGTPHYMSPEQTLAKRAPVDHRTDVFSLGVILYELLTLHRPFDGDNLQQVLYAICFSEPTAIPKLNANAPGDLVTICMKALEKDPAARYESAAAFAADLRRFLRRKPISAKPASWPTRVRKWAQRHRGVSAMTSVVLLIGLVTLSWIWYSSAQRRAQLADAIARVDRAENAGDYRAAIDEMVRAVALAPGDRELSLRHDALRSAWERETAVATRLIAQSSEALHDDADLAINLALEAVDRTAREPEVRQLAERSLLDALTRRHAYRELAIGSWRSALDVAITPNGKHVITASAFGRVQVWDLAKLFAGVEPAFEELEGHRGHVWRLAVSNDGKTLVSAGDDRTVRVWDLDSRRLVEVLRGHERRIGRIALSADGSHLLTGGNDGEVRLWRLADGTCLWREPHSGDCEYVGFAPEGNAFAYTIKVGRSHRCWVRDVAGKILWRYRDDERGGLPAIRFDPKGNWFLKVCGDRVVKLWDRESFEVRQEIETNGSGCFSALSPDGSHLAIALLNRTIDVVRLGENPVRRTFSGPSKRIPWVAFSADSRLLAAASHDRTCRVFDVARGVELASLRSRDPLTRVRIDRDGGRLVTVGMYDFPRIWSLVDERPVLELRGHAKTIAAAAFSKNGRVMTGSTDNLMRMFDTRSGRLLHTHRMGRDVTDVVFSADGKRIAIGTKGGAEVRVIEPSGDRLSSSRIFRVLTPAASSDMSADGRTLAVGEIDGRVRLLSIDTGEVESSIQLQSPVRGVRFSPDARRFAVAEHDSVVRVFAREGQRPLAELAGRGLVHAIAWSRDGKFVAAAREDSTATVWRVADARLVATMRGHTDRVLGLDISPDGKQLATASMDKTVRLWDIASSRERLRFERHEDDVHCVRFSPDGARILTGDLRGGVWVWPAQPIVAAREVRVRPYRLVERKRFDLMRDVDRAAERLVEDLYGEHVLTRDVRRSIKNSTVDEEVRRLALSYASERPNRWAWQLWGYAYNMIQGARPSDEELRVALGFARAAVDVNPYDPPAVRTLGYVLYRMGRYEAAWTELSKKCALPEVRYSPAVHGFRTMCLFKLGRADEARAELARYRSQVAGRDHPVARRLLREAEALDDAHR